MNYHNITYPDMLNGDGLRVVLWLSGCSHHCKGCQNPQTWDANGGILFDDNAKEELFRELDKDYISGLTLSGGDPLYEANLDVVLDIVTEFNKRYKSTQDIVSNKEDSHNILNENPDEIRLSLPTKTIWLYTGYKIKEIYDKNFILHPSASDIANNEPDYVVVEEGKKDKKRSDIIKLCDVVVDGRYVDELRDVSLCWRGSSNQRVIDIQQTLQKGEVVLWAT